MSSGGLTLSFPGAASPGHLARLARLPCTLVWATTWLEDANTEIAPRLGLPDLPVVAWPEPTEAHQREDRWHGLCWKTRTLVNWAAGRPFAWVDDEITDSDRDWVAAHHCEPALLCTIDATPAERADQPLSWNRDDVSSSLPGRATSWRSCSVTGGDWAFDLDGWTTGGELLAVSTPGERALPYIARYPDAG
jgi:hypothetical protein